MDDDVGTDPNTTTPHVVHTRTNLSFRFAPVCLLFRGNPSALPKRRLFCWPSMGLVFSSKFYGPKKRGVLFCFAQFIQGTIVLDGVPPAAVASLQEVGYLPVELAFSLGTDTTSGFA